MGKPSVVRSEQVFIGDGPDGKPGGYKMSRAEIAPECRHSANGMAASSDLFTGDRAKLGDYIEALEDIGKEVVSGDLSILSRTMTAQALSLDNISALMIRKSLANMGEYPEAMERYMRLALKAQSQSRATIEALARMHQPREQTVRHIHVGPEGQAVFIENMHGGFGNARTDGQAHAQGSSGAALLGHDPEGNGLPIAGCEGKETVPNARRRGRKRGSAGE